MRHSRANNRARRVLLMRQNERGETVPVYEDEADVYVGEDAPVESAESLEERLRALAEREVLLQTRERELFDQAEHLQFLSATLKEREVEISTRREELEDREAKLRLAEQLAQEQSSQEPQPAGMSTLKRIQHMLAGGEPLTWMFAGDNVTRLTRAEKGKRSFSEQFAERVRFEMKRAQDVVIDAGIQGATTEQVLKDFEHRLGRFQPDVLSVMVGPQQTSAGKSGRQQFSRELQELIYRCREDDVLLLLHTPNRFVLPAAPPFEDVRTYVRILRELTGERDTPLIDHWAYWKRKRPTDQDLQAWLAPDGIHPSSEGHQALARLLFSALNLRSFPPAPLQPATAPTKK